MTSETVKTYSQEDLRQILNGGAEGFCFRGPQEQDPLGALFSEIQNVGTESDKNVLAGTMVNSTPQEQMSEVDANTINLMSQGAQVEL